MFKKIYIISFLTLLLPLFFAGCADDIFNITPANGEDEVEGLRIMIPHTDFTRAVDGTSNPEEDERKITSLTLFAYDVDNHTMTAKQLKKDGEDDITPTPDGYDPYAYEGIKNGNYMFYIVANVFSGDEATLASTYSTPDLVKNALTDYTKAMMVAPTKGDAYKGLPMSCDHLGMSDEENGDKFTSAVEVKGGKTIYADLEYCLAKVTVNVEGATQLPIELTGASLKDYAGKFPVLTTASTSPTISKGSAVITLTTNELYVTDDSEKTYTFYVPETNYIGQPKLTVNFTYDGNGKSYEIPLGEDNLSNGKDVLRGHHYEYILDTTGKFKLTTYSWQLENIDAEYNGIVELELSQASFAEIESGKEYRIKYSTNQEKIEIKSPVFNGVEFYDSRIEDDEIVFSLNDKVSLKDYNASSEKEKYGYFHVKAGNLLKRVDVKKVTMNARFDVSPQEIIIDLRKHIAAGDEIFNDYKIEFEANVGKVTASWPTKWSDGSGLNDEGCFTVVHEPTMEADGITQSPRSGTDKIKLTGLADGKAFWNTRKELTVTYTLSSYNGDDISQVTEKTKQVHITIIPYSSNYTIHFKSEQPGWDAPHIYIYQCLELPKNLTNNYRGRTVAADSEGNTAALQYCFSSGFAFRGWKGYGGIDANDPYDFNRENNGFVELHTGSSGKSYNPSDKGSLNTTRYMWYGFNTDHYANLGNSRVCSTNHCGNANYTASVSLWPGIVMEKEADGWWKYELSGVAEPGKTLIMFANAHSGDGARRFPGADMVGVPLFDYEDKEGWFLYSYGQDDYTTNRFHDDKPKATPAPSTLRFKKPAGSTWGDKIYVYYYKEGSGKMVEWPGKEMTKNGDVWSYSGIPSNATHVIFVNTTNGTSSGDNNKTRDIKIIKEDNHLYTACPADKVMYRFAWWDDRPKKSTRAWLFIYNNGNQFYDTQLKIDPEDSHRVYYDYVTDVDIAKAGHVNFQFSAAWGNNNFDDRYTKYGTNWPYIDDENVPKNLVVGGEYQYRIEIY